MTRDHGSRSNRRTALLSFFSLVLFIGALVAIRVRERFRRNMEESWASLEALDRRVVELDGVSIEYMDLRSGPCVLVSHGIFHGCDGGQRSARDVVPGHRILAPSRFGYLGSDMPHGADAEAQADAFIALLDNLGIETAAVLGISAGTSAAVQLALRAPNRISHLIVSSGNWPGSPTSEAPPDWAKSFYNDAAMWSLRSAAPSLINGLMGIPKGFPHDDEQAAYVKEMLDSIFPLGPRVEGAIFDAFVSNPEINDYPLEQISVPTLIIHAKDDPLASFEAAQDASSRISGSTLVGLESGGHVGLGQTDRVRKAIAEFLQRP